MRVKQRYEIAKQIDALLMQLEKEKHLGVDETYAVKDARTAVDRLVDEFMPFAERIKRCR